MTMRKGQDGTARGDRMTPLLEVEDLYVSYGASNGTRTMALGGVNLRLKAGETLGVLGESGSGKSTLATALLGMLPPNGRVDGGAVRFAGRDLLLCEARELRKIRGERMALIFQEPSRALHPALRVAEQVRDVLAAHKNVSRVALREKAMQALAAVFPSETERIAQSYPHQLSGGQRARVLIAQSICCEPAMIVADEPTASLDPETQLEILRLFRRLREEFHLSLMWITHNPALLAGFADRVMVLYAGRVAEIGPTAEVLLSPRHPYTEALLRCLPPEAGDGPARRKTALSVIRGEAPVTALDEDRCLFEPRCDERRDVCGERKPAMAQLNDGPGDGHAVSCVKYASSMNS
jgi:oligopeptide/dipeptide ABC transporter ATP-binding protein